MLVGGVIASIVVVLIDLDDNLVEGIAAELGRVLFIGSGGSS